MLNISRYDKNILNLGDLAIYCDFGSEVNKEINHEVIKYFKTLTSKNIKGITNLAPSSQQTNYYI